MVSPARPQQKQAEGVPAWQQQGVAATSVAAVAAQHQQHDVSVAAEQEGEEQEGEQQEGTAAAAAARQQQHDATAAAQQVQQEGAAAEQLQVEMANSGSEVAIPAIQRSSATGGEEGNLANDGCSANSDVAGGGKEPLGAVMR